MLASKFFDDVYFNNAYYARVGGISNVEVNALEMELLRMISFSLFVQPEQYGRYRASLYSHAAVDAAAPSSPTSRGSVEPAVGVAEADATGTGAVDEMMME